MFRIIATIVFLFGLSYTNYINGQINAPPDPCTNGSQNTCQCESSPILCAMDVLDGFEYDMTNYLHQSDGPDNPMCTPNGGGTTAHNPTWFRFAAWCPNITLQITTSNCNHPSGFCNSRGVQLAVFPECNWQNPGNAVACEVNNCRDNAPWSQSFTITMNNLQIGQIYSMVVDGCCNSACHVRIDLVSSPCPPQIGAWPGDIMGPENVCAGDFVEFCVAEPPGGLKYQWMLDGTIIGGSEYSTDGSGQTCFSNVFSTPGTYQLCVDTENECVAITENPPPICKTITVVAPEAGTITANPTPTCPGNDISITVSGNNTDAGILQYIIITDASNTIVKIEQANSTTFTHNQCATFTAYSYNIVDGQGTVPNLGDTFTSSSCSGNCCDLSSVTLSFEDNVAPTINNVPANITVSCYADIPALADLPFTDNCINGGMATGTEVANYTNCDGGSLVRTWNAVDSCGNMSSATQTITIEPIPVPIFEAADNVTVSCEMFPEASFLPPLTYTNGKTGSCLISGTAIPTRVVDTTACMGTVTYTWSVTDVCMRTTTKTQIYTVEPPEEIAFVNPPSDQLTVACADIPAASVLPPLQYTNSSSGRCLIQGTVIPDRTDSYDICGGTIVYLWEKTDSCGRSISYQQTLNIEPAPEASWINPPADVTLPCGQTLDPAFMPDLAYSNGATAGSFCEIAGIVTPTRTDNITGCEGTVTFYWEFTDACSRTISHTQVYTLSPPDEPAWINPPVDITVQSCDGFDYDDLPPLNYDNGGTGADCLISGNVTPVRTGNVDDCQGTYTYTWEYTDKCGRTITHTRTITVVPPDEAAWVNPPADMTVECINEPDASAVDLNYTNGSSGMCLISGTVSAVPTVQENSDCSKVYTYEWMVTDLCGRTITHTQTINVNPPPEAVFINPPADITVQSCDGFDVDELAPLNYDNGIMGDCGIAGSEVPVRTGSVTDCQGVYTYTWTFSDNCGRTIQHVRTVTVVPPAEAQFINPPANTTLNCIDAPDLSNPPVLSYTNNLTGTCEISGSVPATITDNSNGCQGSYQLVWEFTDNCGRTIQHTQIITVNPPDEPAFINLPPPVSNVTCENEPDPNNIPTLMYTNNSSGSCLIAGEAPGRLDIQDNGCAKIYTYTWNFTDPCDRTIQYSRIVNVQPPPVAVFIDPPVYTSMSCEDADNLQVPDLQYSNNSVCDISGTLSPTVVSNYNACGGTINIEWKGVDACGRSLNYSQIIIVNPAPPPVITTPLPQDITVSCQDLNQYAITLDYSNEQSGNCERSGRIQGVLNNAGVTLCGGTATVTWQANDGCGTSLNHTQRITIEPTPPAVFLDPPPASQVIACTEIPSNPPPLQYSNGESGFCGINGTITPIQTGGATACGGIIQYTWQFTDACNRSIIYNQDVTILPADDPWFTTDPEDEFSPCNAGFPDPYPLIYTNLAPGNCGIDGSVMPTYTDNGDTRTFTWTYTNQCTGTTITEQQTVTISPVPDLVADPVDIDICYGDIYDLADIVVTDLNGTNITLSYHDGTPATSANQLFSTLVLTDIIDKYYILATNEHGCTDEIEIRFHNQLPPDGAFGKNLSLCVDSPPISLYDLLYPGYNNNGYWSDEYGTGINIDDPTSVSFAGQPAGDYTFVYVIPSIGVCPDILVEATVTLLESGSYDIGLVKCSPDFNTYFVEIITGDFTITSSAGNVSSNGGLTTISNIPIAQSVTITLTPISGNCADQFIVIDPPQCNCDVIPKPISGGNKKACLHQTGIMLDVTVENGLTAQWYSADRGGTLLLDGPTSFAPPTDVVGLFTYYVQAIDPVTRCFSQRQAITFEVLPLPVANNAVLKVCNINQNGIAEYNLVDANALISSGGGLTFTYYLNQADAENEMNPLVSPFTNTVPDQVIYASVKNVNGCKKIVMVTLSTSPLPSITYNVENETCVGAKDGKIIINPPYDNLEFKLNALPWSNNPEISGLQPGSYTLQVRDMLRCINIYSVIITPGQNLKFEEFSLNCDNKGTLSDGNDDVYNLVMNISSNPASNGTYRIVYNGQTIHASLAYGVQHSLSLSADGSSGIIEIIDNATGCKITRNAGPLTPCSTNCAIDINGLDISCDNSGTDADPADDIYTITFVASAVNQGASTSFTLLINNVITGTYNYGETVTFTMPADGSSPDIRVRDFLNLQCFSSIQVGTLLGCSGSCLIVADVSDVRCNDNGTINDPNDDTFTFALVVNGFNTSAFWQIEGNNQLYEYNTKITLGPFPVSGGDVTLTIRDQADPSCSKFITIPAPPPCSTPCVLSISDLQISACDDNKTGDTDADDTYNITFKVNVVSGSTNFYNVTYAGKSYGPFNYGQVANITGLPANGQELTFIVTDAINAGCTLSFTAIQNPCSSCKQTVDAGTDIVLTCSQNTATLTATASEQGGIFVWSGPNGFSRTGQTITTNTEGVYIVTVTFPDQCVATDQVTVTKDANIPDAFGGKDQTLNCVITEIMLTGSTTSQGNNLIFQWTDAGGNIISNTTGLLVNQPGSYYFEVINTETNCSSGKSEVRVTEDVKKPLAQINADPGPVLDCIIGTVTLSGEPIANVIFNWNTGETHISNQPSIVISKEGTITMIAIDTINGCDNLATIDIIDLQDYPILITKPAEPITCLNNGVYISAGLSPGGPNLMFQWFDVNNKEIKGQNADSLYVTSPGIYYVVLTDTLNHCSNRDTFEVERIGDFPQVKLPEDIGLYCGENTASLTAQIINPTSDIVLTWSTPDGNILSDPTKASIEIEGSGTYQVDVVYPVSGCKTKESLTVTVDDNYPVDMRAVVNDETCEQQLDGQIAVASVSGGKEPITFKLSNGLSNTTGQFSPLAPGKYTLEVIDANGCVLDTSFVINAGHQVQLFATSPVDLIYNHTQILEIITNLKPDEIASIVWTPSDNLSCDDCLVTTVTGIKNTTYEVVITDINGCTQSVKIVIRVDENVIITVPNIFNPGSTINKYFSVFGNESIVNIEKLAIYDRWGNLVFLNENFKPNVPSEGWDGSFHGRNAAQGVYVYIIHYETPNGVKVLTGDVTLIR